MVVADVREETNIFFDWFQEERLGIYLDGPRQISVLEKLVPLMTTVQ